MREEFFIKGYFQDELNITKRLLVAVISEGENLRTQENLFNWTLQSYVSDIVYFGNNSKEEESGTKAGPPDILDILKQISTHHLTQYQLFFIIPSTSALHGKNIKQFTAPLSPLVGKQPVSILHIQGVYWTLFKVVCPRLKSVPMAR